MIKKGLGRGLDALLSPSKALKTMENLEVQPGEKVQKILLEQIVPNPYQPRQSINPDKLEELAASIKHYGVVQPIVLTPLDEGHYQLVAGERRWRACVQLEMTEIPAIIREYTELEMAAIALIENIQRESLNPLEDAQIYCELMDKCSWTQEELGLQIGKSRSVIANTVRLLALPAEVRALILENKLSAGHGRALLGLDSPELQIKAAARILEQQLNVRQTEKLIQELNKSPAALPKPQKTYRMKEWENQLAAALSSEVKIVRQDNGRGKIVISYKQEDELRWMVGVITGQEPGF
ncbi:MAG: ParB/RepB/Spo0J family partition protein [Clostridia bacterium]|nr:ParB/RepB/Spo0J family partition protein [Clostridia bacterium]